MKRRLIVLFLLAIFSTFFCACKNVEEKNNIINKDNKTENVIENEKGYFANDADALNIIYDYEVVYSICNDACQEFARAVREQNKADFTLYMNNDSLQSYMQYRVENHIFSYNENTEYKLMITEVNFDDDYVLVSGITGAVEEPNSYSLQGMNHFLIKNVDGRFYIVEWYWDAMDSPDVELRGEFSVENNLTFWDEPEKYEPILKKVVKHN